MNELKKLLLNHVLLPRPPPLAPFLPVRTPDLPLTLAVPLHSAGCSSFVVVFAFLFLDLVLVARPLPIFIAVVSLCGGRLSLSIATNIFSSGNGPRGCIADRAMFSYIVLTKFNIPWN